MLFPLALTVALLLTLPEQAQAQEQEQPTPAPAPAPVSPDVFPEIVARVNGTDITKESLLRRADALRNQLPSFEAGSDFYQRVLADMVGGELLYQAAAVGGFLPEPTQVDAEIQAQSERFGGPDGFTSALESQGLTLAQVRTELEKEMAVQTFIERELIPTVAVTEESKKAFYDENPDEMKRPEQFRVAHILIGVDEQAPQEEKDEARRKALAIRSMLDVGQDFGELAQRNSDDPGSRDTGGELPWLSPGQTVPPFEAAALALEEGELSDLVETQFGYHIIRLLERRDAGLMPYEEVAPQIEEFLMRRGLQQRLDEKIESLTAQGNVEVFI